MTSALPILHGPDRPELLRGEVLADLFEATAARLPHKTALIAGGEHLSYGALNAAADLAAHRLILAGVRPGMVGLWLPRGLELLICQLAIAKTGAAWLPFDAEVPTGASPSAWTMPTALLISSYRRPPCSPNGYFSANPHGAGGAGAAAGRRTTAPPRGAARHPAYVIYTSGSTGKPKGIAITQASICHFLRSENARLGVREDDRVYQGFSVAFDMSFEEIWISYLVGATLWLAPRRSPATRRCRAR
jgi:non-ribosomal peptide synthetase component F